MGVLSFLPSAGVAEGLLWGLYADHLPLFTGEAPQELVDHDPVNDRWWTAG